MASMISRLMDAVQTRIVANVDDLVGFPGSANITTGIYISQENVEFPHIFVTPVGSETTKPGDNRSDDWTRPILVTIAVRDHEDRQDLTILEWREVLLKLFCEKGMKVEVPGYGHYRMQLNPGNQIDIVKDQYQYIVSSFTLLPTGRELRNP